MTEQQQVCFDDVVQTPIGWVAVRLENAEVTRIEVLTQNPALCSRKENADQATQVCTRLNDYFSRASCWPTDVPLNPAGTSFQKRVWSGLMAIPNGETMTYGELAKKLGTSARAVGGACRANPIPLLIPCHRVVAANGDGGFSGHTQGHWLDIKRWLLAHEQ